MEHRRRMESGKKEKMGEGRRARLNGGEGR
jgi:hypothetical protein